MKKIAQVLASLAYTPIYTGLVYLATTLPICWAVSLPKWQMIAVIVILGFIFEGLLALLQVIGSLPFVWITRDNNIAKWISIILCIVLPICNAINLWIALLPIGTWGIIAAVLCSYELLRFIFISVSFILDENRY